MINNRYHVLRGANLNYWGNRQPDLEDPLSRNTLTVYLSETLRTTKASLVGEKSGLGYGGVWGSRCLTIFEDFINSRRSGRRFTYFPNIEEPWFSWFSDLMKCSASMLGLTPRFVQAPSLWFVLRYVRPTFSQLEMKSESQKQSDRNARTMPN